jgi:hypothetical protein
MILHPTVALSSMYCTHIICGFKGPYYIIGGPLISSCRTRDTLLMIRHFFVPPPPQDDQKDESEISAGSLVAGPSDSGGTNERMDGTSYILAFPSQPLTTLKFI